MKKPLLLSRRALELSVLFGLLCAVFLSFSHFNTACDDLRENVLRLHILANSDEAADQQVKLKVRDEILRETSQLFEGQQDVDGAIGAADRALDRLEQTANRVLAENGFDYTASASVGDSFFETREYEDFTLPAGSYPSLILRLGEGGGHNWWCVVYPSVCVPAASGAELSDSTAKGSAEIAGHPTRYTMRFKAVEWYEELKKMLKK